MSAGRVADMTAAERFWAKVKKTPTCWLWVGARKPKGYGNFWVNGRWVGAHVFAWELAHGPVPPGFCVLHRCDVRPCLRDDHLFLGTKPENSEDMVAKNRSGKGERNSQSKLTQDDVVAIRASVEPQRSIAAQFGVSQSLVSMIRAGKLWGHG